VEKSNQITWPGNHHAIFAPVYSTPQLLIMTFCCTSQTLRRFSISGPSEIRMISCFYNESAEKNSGLPSGSFRVLRSHYRSTAPRHGRQLLPDAGLPAPTPSTSEARLTPASGCFGIALWRPATGFFAAIVPGLQQVEQRIAVKCPWITISLYPTGNRQCDHIQFRL